MSKGSQHRLGPRRPVLANGVFIQLGLAQFKPTGGTSMEAYCFKCRTKREISNPQQITMKNGRPATRGTCPVCGTKVFRIGKV